MSLTTIRYDRERLERAVKTVETQFPDKIERIRYSVGEDWADDPALFFRVLLKDSSDTRMIRQDEGRKHIFDLSRVIIDALRSNVHADDLQPYFAFRSVSEQEKLRDPKWD
jgi:hypothetical protein